VHGGLVVGRGHGAERALPGPARLARPAGLVHLAAAAGVERRTRGGSWWYGAAQMRADHLQSKPPATAVVYIGFRCARPR
jgi:formylglycine-generating enzyme required for sulfatase activity